MQSICNLVKAKCGLLPLSGLYSCSNGCPLMDALTHVINVTRLALVHWAVQNVVDLLCGCVEIERTMLVTSKQTKRTIGQQLLYTNYASVGSSTRPLWCFLRKPGTVQWSHLTVYGFPLVTFYWHFLQSILICLDLYLGGTAVHSLALSCHIKKIHEIICQVRPGPLCMEFAHSLPQSRLTCWVNRWL